MDSRKQIRQIMTNLLITFFSAILIGCTDGNGASQRITGKDAHDSIMLADGYEMLPLFKTKTGHITVTIKVNGKYCLLVRVEGNDAVIRNLDIDKNTYQPVCIRMRVGNNKWNRISILTCKTNQKFSDKTFTFDKNEFPGLEVIDLR